MHNFLLENQTEINLTSEQWGKLNVAFEGKLQEVLIFTGDDAASVVYRLGLILYRICMIFTAIRKFENGETTHQMNCIDDDFEAALMLSDVFLAHALLMFNNLSEKSESTFYKMPNNKKRLFELLPYEFKRIDAVEIGKSLGISERSVGDFLKDSIPTLLEKPKTGFYRKVKID